MWPHGVSVCICNILEKLNTCEPVWPSGKVGTEAEGPRFDAASALLSLQKLWSVDTQCLVTLSLTIMKH